MAGAKQRKWEGAGGKIQEVREAGGRNDAGLLCHFKDSGCDFLLRKMRSHQKVLYTKKKIAWRGGEIRLMLKSTNWQQVVNKP